MISAIIVDGQQLGIDSLKWELSRLDVAIDIIATFTESQDAVQFLKTEQIDLLFLDIQMPEMNGFELLDSIEKPNFSVIFVTTYDEFAIKAFKYAAMEYLLKPVDSEDLKEALQKFYRFGAVKRKERTAILRDASNGNLPKRVSFSTKETIELIEPKDILYCEADSNYTTLFLDETKLVVSKTLKEVEALLLDYSFCRVHQSYLVNPAHILRYLKADGGTVVMQNNKEIPVSRSKKEGFLKIITS